MYIIAGCNGAGKTTASYTLLPEMLNLRIFVNADEIAEKLSPQDPSVEAVRAIRLSIERMYDLIEKDEDFAIETTLATRSLSRIVKDAQAKGYMVNILYFWLKSPEAAVARVARRYAAGGHTIPEADIHRRYWHGIRNLRELYLPICNYWVLFDNSKGESEKIAEGGMSLPVRVYRKKLYHQLIIKSIDNENK